MLNPELSKAETWAEPIERIVRMAESKGEPQIAVGHISDFAVGSVGNCGATIMFTDRRTLARIISAVSDGEIAYSLTGRPDGSAEVLVVDAEDPHLAGMAHSGPIEGVVIVPDSLPEPYRRLPETHAGQRLSPGCDPALVEELARAWSDEPPATDGLIEDVERELGCEFPPDVRALYATVGSGALYSDAEDDDWDEDTWDDEDYEPARGMLVAGLDEVEARSWASPHRRMMSWRFGADLVIPPDPDGRLQPLGHSPYWFVIGHDEEGGFFAVDLAPGPNGHVGQVIHLARHLIGGAYFVAPSLTEFLQNGMSDELPAVDVGALCPEYVARINDDTRLEDAVRPNTEVVIQCTDSGTIDLTPLAAHPTIRTVSLCGTNIVGLDTLADLPALEYLSMPIELWHRLIETGPLPTGLLAVGFESPDDTFESGIALADQLLTHYGRRPLNVIRIQVPPEA